MAEAAGEEVRALLALERAHAIVVGALDRRLLLVLFPYRYFGFL